MLNAGDIAIVGFRSDNPDEFSFVALVDIPAGEVIRFTDNGVRTDGSFRANEGTVTWTAPAGGVGAGTIVSFAGNSAFSAPGNFALAADGDQVIAYQDNGGTPAFLFAVQSNSTLFQADATNANTSALPPGLTLGQTAVAVGAGAGAGDEFDNVYYSGTTSGTREQLLAAIANAANWTGSDTGYAPVTTPFTVTTDEPEVPEAAFTLELLHFTDQEASTGAISDAPNLSAVLNALRAQDIGGDGLADNTLTLSSGDAYIPGVFLDASQAAFSGFNADGTVRLATRGVADIQIQNELGVQAIAFGNHEFDLGTALVRDLISGSAYGNFSAADFAGTDLAGTEFGGAEYIYLSSTINFETDPNLAGLEVPGGGAPVAAKVSSSTVIDVNGELIGVVGATTPTLRSISSPGSLTLSPSPFDGVPTPAQLDALAAVIQAEVDAVLAANPGMNKVILLTHMQRIDIEFALAERLTDVDVIVAGGSNTRLFDEDDRIRAGDSDQGQYPQFFTNPDGKSVAVVNTDGSYKYVGRLVIDFDADGNIIPTSYDADVSGAYATDDQGVADLGAQALIDPEVQAIVDQIEQEIILTESNVFGFSDVFLNGQRSGTNTGTDPDGVRNQETNLGNLTADANLAAGKQFDAATVVSIKNGGGIRASIGEIVVPAGETTAVRIGNRELVDGDGVVFKPEGGISETDIKKALAFNNDLSLITLTVSELVAVLEHGVRGLPSAVGAFPQLSGVRFSYDDERPAGARVINAGIFDDEGGLIAELVRDGVVSTSTETFRVVTLRFMIDGGDGYVFPTGPAANIVHLATGETAATRSGDALFANDGTEQDALAEYLDDKYSTTAYAEADLGRASDTRIQDVDFTADTVFDGVVVEPEFTLISEIQGVTDYAAFAGLAQVGVDDVSALSGQIVTIQAIVTADFQAGANGTATSNLRGFFVQEETVDQDDNAFSSEGLFIFEGSLTTNVSVGDLVTITGTVVEFGGTTQLTATDIIVVNGGNVLPPSVTVTFPATGVMLDAAGGYVADLEAYEGMLVTVPTVMSVTEMFNLDRFGEYKVSSDGRLTQYTQDNAPSVAGNDAHLRDAAARSLMLDDGRTSQNPSVIEIIDGNNGVLDATDSFRMGDTLTGITGVLNYAFDEFRVQDATGTYAQVNPRPESPDTLPGNFSVASLNVLNYFTTLDTAGSGPFNSGPNNDQEPRGANSAAEFERQYTKLVNTIVELDADVLGLIEIENDADIAVADLVGRVNARLGSAVYDYVETGDLGGDAITQAFIYKTGTTELVGDFAALTTFDGRNFLNPLGAANPQNRPALAQTFRDTFSGETLTVAVNHLKSKGSLSGLAADADQGDGQGNNNATRAAAADILADWLASDPTGQGSENVLIIGDLNSYAQEDPITVLEAAGYTDLAYDAFGPAGLTYVFDGMTGTLDYALANAALNELVAGVTQWNINADEADAIDYNLDFSRPANLFDGSSAARGSDHDPVLVSFQFDQDVYAGTTGSDVLSGTGKNDIFISNGGGADLIRGLGGDDVFDISALLGNGRRDTIRITDFEEGETLLGLDASDIAQVRIRGDQVTLLLTSDRDLVTLDGIDSFDHINFSETFLT